ncbi:hypothetical protein C8R43DRAFT_947454 [Mycena crocata]|nr:hypothetical protein C8R43DRAFT_947454 [Mycena crocata]
MALLNGSSLMSQTSSATLNHLGNAAYDTDEQTKLPTMSKMRLRSRNASGRLGVLLDIDEDPGFSEVTEFDSEDSRIQGQLRDIIALLPEDARDIRKQSWIGDSFNDGMSGQRSTINTRLRHESLMHIVEGIKFQDGEGIDIKDFESSSSRFAAFAERIGYQKATEDADAFYSPLKAEILFDEYDGTMDTTKVFRGPALPKTRNASATLR